MFSVNPYVTVRLDFSAPVPGRGLVKNRIRVDRENVHEIIQVLSEMKSLAEGREHYLSSSTIEKLLENGLLCMDEDKPNRPAFACVLDDAALAEVSTMVSSDSTANVSAYELNPLAYFQFDDEIPTQIEKQWLRAGLSDARPICWVENPGTRLVEPFWFGPKVLDWVLRLRTKEVELSDAPADVLDLLKAANIVVRSEHNDDCKSHWDLLLEQAATDLRDNKYVVLPKTLNHLQFVSLRAHARTLESQGFFETGDGQVPLRNTLRDEPIVRHYHNGLSKLINHVVPAPIKPSYSMLSAYKSNAVLRRHKDREQHAWNVSFVLDMGSDPCHERPWPFFLEPVETTEQIKCYEQTEELIANEQRHEVRLELGAAVLYSGTQTTHGRNALPAPQLTTIAIFAFVAEQFVGSLT